MRIIRARRISYSFSICLLLLLAISSAFHLTRVVDAATFVVNTTADTVDANPGDGICQDSSGNCSLRAAIMEANAFAGNDVITLPAGTYTLTIPGQNEQSSLTGDLDITSNIVINGAGATSTVVQAAVTKGSGIDRVFDIRGATIAEFNNLKIRHGRINSTGGGLRVEATGLVGLTLFNVDVSDNEATGASGGGVSIASMATGSLVTIDSSRVSDNISTGPRGGGIVNFSPSGELRVIDSMVIGNFLNSTGPAGGGGIGVRGQSTTTVINTNITFNAVSTSSVTEDAYGGGISLIEGSFMTITGGSVSSNGVNSNGSNTAYAGGIHNQDATLSISNSIVSSNSSANNYGGVRTSGFNSPASTNITSTLIEDNIARAVGAGVANSASGASAVTTIVSSIIRNNTFTATAAEGGGLYNRSSGSGSATTNITDSTISGHSFDGDGGGVFNEASSGGSATVNINRVTILNNILSGSGSDGGGIMSRSEGAGAANINILNSTISGNAAGNLGGGIRTTGATGNNNVVVDFSTVANNSAVLGGGLSRNGGAFSIKNSIIDGNTAVTNGPDMRGTITSGNYNHVSSLVGATFTPASNDVTGTSAMLGALGNNGGDTFTHLPSNSSLIVNSIPPGTNGCASPITVDQRNISRPVSFWCDKGSVETSGTTSSGVSISGRVLNSIGKGVPGVVITVEGDALQQPLTIRTNSFGRYEFPNLPAGEMFVLTAKSGRLRFQRSSMVVSSADSLTDQNFVVDER